MFTSKKALVLSKKLDKISPITNIDTLYYELATFDGSDFTIKRRSVTKTMPINVNFIDSSNFNYLDGGTPTPLDTSTEPTIISSGFEKRFDGNFVKYTSNYMINLSDILYNYKTKEDFDSSINYLDNLINQLINEFTIYANNKINNENIGNINTSIRLLFSELHNIDLDIRKINGSVNKLEISINSINSSIFLYYNYPVYSLQDLKILVMLSSLQTGYYYLKYIPSEDHSTLYYKLYYNYASFLIELYYNKKTSSFISTGRAKNYDITANNFDADNCYVEYDFLQEKITYLRDKFGNEGNFDFINLKACFYNCTTDGFKQIVKPIFLVYNENCINNKLFNVIDPSTGYCNISFSGLSPFNNYLSNIEYGKCYFLGYGCSENVIKNLYNNKNFREPAALPIVIQGSNNKIINFNYTNTDWGLSEAIKYSNIYIYSNNCIINNNYDYLVSGDEKRKFVLAYNDSTSLNMNLIVRNTSTSYYTTYEKFLKILEFNNCNILNSNNNMFLGMYSNTIGGYEYYWKKVSTSYRYSSFMLNENIRLYDVSVRNPNSDLSDVKYYKNQIYIGSHLRTYYTDLYKCPIKTFSRNYEII